jgi:hypothetical protein
MRISSQIKRLTERRLSEFFRRSRGVLGVPFTVCVEHSLREKPAALRADSRATQHSPIPVSGADQFFVRIAFARVVDPLRPCALKAFEEFFFGRAREVYPRHDFARMNDDEYGAILGLD